MNPVDRFLAAIGSAGAAQKSGQGWLAFCPAHDDGKKSKRRSLSIGVGESGNVLLHCFAGCNSLDIAKRVGIEPAELFGDGAKSPAKAAPRARSGPAPWPTRNGVPLSASWTYRDAAGAIIGHVGRYDGPDGKQYVPFFKRDGKSLTSGYVDGPRPLYALDRIAKAPEETVWIVEGEKAADALLALGIIATTSPGGSSAAARTDWTPLSGRRVAIWPDNDEPGEAYARAVEVALSELRQPVKAERIDVKKLNLQAKGDAHDWAAINPKAKADDVKKLQRSRPDDRRFRTLSYVEILEATEIEPQGVFGDGLLDKSGVMIISAPPKRGKSYLSIHAALCLASGIPFLRWPVPEPLPVLYVNAEIGLHRFRERIDKATSTLDEMQLGEFGMRFHAATRPQIDLSNPVDFGIIEREVSRVGAGLVVLDPVSSIWFGKENEAEEVSKLFAAIRHLAAETGASFLLCHHSSKNSGSQDDTYQARGSGVWASAPETIVNMSKPRGAGQWQTRLIVRGTNASADLELLYDPERGWFDEIAASPKPVGGSVADGLNARQIVAILRELGPPLSKAKLIEKTGLPEPAFRRAITWANEARWVQNLNDGKPRKGALYDLGKCTPEGEKNDI